MDYSNTHNGSVPVISAMDVQQMRAIVDGLFESPAPTQVISKLLSREMSPLASTFERYAALVLRDAGARRLVELPPGSQVRLLAPGNGSLARLVSSHAPSPDDKTTVMSVEGALNRLLSIVDAIEDSAGSNLAGSDDPAIRISFLGPSYSPKKPAYRSALVSMPTPDQGKQPTIEYLNEVDWRMLDNVASISKPVFQSSMLPNMHQSFMGAHGPAGSDWDVRTRLASSLRRLELSLPFRYRFDCCIPRQTASVRFLLPPLSSLPQRRPDPAGSGLASLGDAAPSAHLTYAMRLACLLAATCFGSGRRIEHAVITADASESQSMFTMAFSRRNFVYNTLVAIENGEMSDPRYRYDSEAIMALIAPDAIEYASSHSSEAIRSIFEGVESQRVAPHLDERSLPDDMQDLFRSKRMCDIDTKHFFRGFEAEVKTAQGDARESSVAAIANLEQIIEELEAMNVPPDDDAKSRPLYCSNPLSRAMVSLLDDYLAVGTKAEAFLDGSLLEEIPSEDLPRFFRCPNALFEAHLGLSLMYEKLGDARGAESEADRCIALAPLSAQAHYRKADVLAQNGRYAEAANVLLGALRFSVSPADCALLYYHLALVFWNLDRKRDAAAILVYASTLSGGYAEKAAAAVRSLRNRKDSPVIAHASPLAATRDMARARIPIAPSDEARLLIVRAAIGLSCANAPLAAAPYAAALTRYFRDDDVIADTATSLATGTAW